MTPEQVYVAKQAIILTREQLERGRTVVLSQEASRNLANLAESGANARQLLQYIYDNLHGIGGSTIDTVTGWQLDTTDYAILEDYLYSEGAKW